MESNSFDNTSGNHNIANRAMKQKGILKAKYETLIELSFFDKQSGLILHLYFRPHIY